MICSADATTNRPGPICPPPLLHITCWWHVSGAVHNASLRHSPYSRGSSYRSRPIRIRVPALHITAGPLCSASATYHQLDRYVARALCGNLGRYVAGWGDIYHANPICSAADRVYRPAAMWVALTAICSTPGVMVAAPIWYHRRALYHGALHSNLQRYVSAEVIYSADNR